MIPNRSGVVLFVVVIVIALVSLAAYSFSIQMRSELYGVRLHGDQVQSQMMTESALCYLNSWAEASRSERDLVGGIDVNELLFRNVLVDGGVDPLRPGLFSIVRPPDLGNDMAEIDRYPAPISERANHTPLTFGTVNESSKLHLQTVLAWDLAEPGAGRTALLAIPGMTESLADAILDWIDEDDEVREFGAEGDFYRSLNPPREPANRVPRSMNELLQIRGVTAEQLFGFDKNRNFEIEPFERPQVSQGDAASIGSDPQAGGDLAESDIPPLSHAQPGIDDFDDDHIPEPWSHYLTVTAAERNVDYYGRVRIYLNHPDLATLHRKLESSFGVETANFVIALRQSGPYDGTDKPSQAPISRQPLSKKSEYDVVNLATLLNAKVATGTGENRKVHASPWLHPQQSDASASFSTFCDAVTIHESPVIVGRVNLASAPREVLHAIPEITSEQVEQIIAARSESQTTRMDGDSIRLHPYWLVEEEVLEVKTFERVSEFLTMGGDVLNAQLVGYYLDESPNHRVEVIVDGTDLTSRPLYYADLTRHGGSFSLGQLAPPADAMPPTPSTNGIAPQIPGR